MASSSSSSAIDWNAANYLRFADERTRPARDLLAAIPPLPSPSSTSPRIIDLGCGPANSTALLAARYGCISDDDAAAAAASGNTTATGARITGVDSSPDMLAKARAALPGARFVEGDLRTYEPAGDDGVDLFFSNAALHWLPPAELLPRIKRWIARLEPGGVFAAQVPDNVREPSHALMGEAARRCGLGGRVAGAGRAPFPGPRALVEELSAGGLCESVDVWETAYWHRLRGGHAAVVDWFRESGFRPFLEKVGTEEGRRKLERAYEELLRDAYPVLADGRSVLLRFPRLFLVCVRR